MIAKSLFEWIDAGLRQADLAKTASLSLGTISNVERGEDVSFDRIISLLRVLGGLRGLDAILALFSDNITIPPHRIIDPPSRFRRSKKKRSPWKWGDEK